MHKLNDIEKLFRENYARMYNLAFNLLGNQDLSHDIVQNVFARVLETNINNVTVTYLMKGIRFECNNHIRSLSTKERIMNLYSLENNEAEESDDDIESQEKIRSIVDNELTEQCRRVVKLRFDNQLSYREIAEELSISETAVYKHINKAINILRKKFKADER